MTASFDLAQLKLALDKHAILSVTDAQGVILEVNDKFCKLSGYTRDELLGQNHRLLKSGKHASGFYSDLWQTISSGKIWQGVICNRAKNGALYWVDSTIVPFLSDQRCPERYISIRTDITELWQQKETGRRKVSLFELAAASTGLGLTIGYPQVRQVILDDRTVAIYDLPPDMANKFLPQDVLLSRVHPDDLSAVLQTLKSAVSSPGVHHQKHAIITDSGETRYIKLTLQSELDDGLRILTTTMDITSEVLQERALQDAITARDRWMKRLQIGASAADLFVYDENIDRETGEYLIYPNATDETKLLVGRALWQAVPVEYHSRLVKLFQNIGEWVEFPIVLPVNGRKKWVSQAVVAQFEQNGERYRTIFTLDVTERVHRENELMETLKANEQLIKQTEELSEWMTAAVLHADIYLYEENVEQGTAVALFKGSDPSEKPVVGKALFAAVPHEYHDRIIQAIEHPGVTVEFPVNLPGYDKPKWVRHSVIRRFERDGQSYNLAMSMNITNLVEQRQQLENALDEHREALIENRSLLNSLEESNRKKNQVYGMIAHELRTPVSAIQMMADDDSAEEWKVHQKEVLNASRQLLHTIDDMRMVVNPDLKRPTRIESFTINELASSIATNVTTAVTSTGFDFQLKFDLAPGLMERRFSSDVYRIKVALTNLIRNACLHSGGSQVSLKVSAESTDQQHWFLYWTVSDDGKGIAPEEVERLFDPFVRGDTHAEGTGLGLHIARSWIQEIGGDLTYSPDSPATGAEFRVFFPVISQALEDQQLSPDRDECQKANAVLLRLNVLLVDDDLMLRTVGQQFLSKMVSSVELAENGLAAMQALSSASGADVDLILTDYFMPEMNGVEMIRALRLNGYTRPIIGLTAATLGNQTQDLIDAGADIVIPKPLTKEVFIESVLELLKKGRIR